MLVRPGLNPRALTQQTGADPIELTRRRFILFILTDWQWEAGTTQPVYMQVQCLFCWVKSEFPLYTLLANRCLVFGDWTLYHLYITAARLAQLGERRSAEREAVGSNPGRTNTQGL